MAVGNRRMRRRLVLLLALGGLGYYFLYSAGRLDPLFNAHRCAVREFYSLVEGACVPCTACYAGEETISPCHGTSDTKCRLCRPNAEYLRAGVCVPCSACSINQSTLRACEATVDTICSDTDAGEQAKRDTAGFHDTSDSQIKHELRHRTVLPPTEHTPATRPGPSDVAAEAAVRFAHPPAPTPQPSPPDGLPSFDRSEAADVSWKPVFGRTTTGPLVPNTKDWIEEGWGADCYSEKNMDVLVALPYSPKMVSDCPPQYLLRRERKTARSEIVEIHLLHIVRLLLPASACLPACLPACLSYAIG